MPLSQPVNLDSATVLSHPSLVSGGAGVVYDLAYIDDCVRDGKLLVSPHTITAKICCDPNCPQPLADYRLQAKVNDDTPTKQTQRDSRQKCACCSVYCSPIIL